MAWRTTCRHADSAPSTRARRCQNSGPGRVHDWDLSRAFVEVPPHPVVLAGGLTPENVGRAIRHVRPFGVDLCNGVRVAGRLNRERLTAFAEAVQAADGALVGRATALKR